MNSLVSSRIIYAILYYLFELIKRAVSSILVCIVQLVEVDMILDNN